MDGRKIIIIPNREPRILFVGIVLPLLLDMIIMADQFINGIKTVSAETGIPGMENAAVIIGFVMDIIVLGYTI